jgi:7,8-dihydropterin-6-yl-methyl-4-(beta-D-ribofuranosyl)aminobenzene 5'-phosphate synthase
VQNLDRLGVPPDSFEAVVLSYGHFDHVAGMHGLVRRSTARPLPVHVHPDAWTRRRISTADRFLELPTLDRAALVRAGLDVVEETGPSLLAAGGLLLTGEVPRTTGVRAGPEA